MKTFICSSLAFLALLSVITVNCFYINRVADRLESDLVSMTEPASAEQPLLILKDYWERNKALVGLSVSFEEVHNMTEYLLELQIAAREQDTLEFERSRALALNAAAELRRLEQFGLANLL
ncbi:MAG: DUF4363 family protein [Ruminococcaceae bacterium]|nr:DUF4363 family protein [Oscillospiraceae bacterium]